MRPEADFDWGIFETPAPSTDPCSCPPEGPCFGVPGESDACGACLRQDPESSCLHDPDVFPVSPDTPTPSSDVERSTAFLDVRTAHDLLDDLGANPRKLSDTVAGMRDTLLDVVRTRSDARRSARVAKLAGETPSSSSDVRVEVVGACDDAEVLDALASAFTTAAKEAKAIAGDLLDEVPGRGGKPRASIKVGDGKGFDLTLTRSKRTELSVDHAAVDDVLAAARIAEKSMAVGTEDLDSYAQGFRSGIAALREVLATSPAYRSTALDSLTLRLEDAGEDDLAKRLRKAYARVEKGEPTVKVERKPITKGAGE